MFGSGPRYNKLKTNLKLCINRLKLLEKKKTELSQKSRREISEYIANGKEDRARIRVEHIIREDYMVEAMELLEMYCDLLLARFGLIQQMKTLDDGLAEPISSVIWAAPRLLADIPEMKILSDELTSKYGKQYAQAVRENCLRTVNPKLMQKLGVEAPPKMLVESYMMEIAKSYNIPFEPDPEVMRQNDLIATEALEAECPLIDFDNYKKNRGGGGGGGGSNAPPIGFLDTQPQPFNYPTQPPSQSLPPMPQIPDVPKMPPSQNYPSHIPGPGGFTDPSPSYESVVNKHENPPRILPPGNPPNPVDTLPELPSVPINSLPKLDSIPPPGSNSGGDPDFDDLAKRFEELKKRK